MRLLDQERNLSTRELLMLLTYSEEGAIMRIEDGKIFAGLSISNIKLDITREELLDIIGEDYEESEINETDTTITIENASFWIDYNGKVSQIGVWGDFQGRYRDIIGIGSTLEDVKEHIGNYDEEYDTYGIENEKGICFELGDMDDDCYWDELKAPIESIYVYKQKDKE